MLQLLLPSRHLPPTCWCRCWCRVVSVLTCAPPSPPFRMLLRVSAILSYCCFRCCCFHCCCFRYCCFRYCCSAAAAPLLLLRYCCSAAAATATAAATAAPLLLLRCCCSTAAAPLLMLPLLQFPLLLPPLSQPAAACTLPPPPCPHTAAGDVQMYAVKGRSGSSSAVEMLTCSSSSRGSATLTGLQTIVAAAPSPGPGRGSRKLH